MTVNAFKEDIESRAYTEDCFANQIFKKIQAILCAKLGDSTIKLSKDDSYFATHPDNPLSKLFSQDECPMIDIKDLNISDLLLDKGAMISPLRISTQKTKLISKEPNEDYKQTNYFQQLKANIKDQKGLPTQDKKELLSLVDALETVSQELFAQTMSEIYMEKLKDFFKSSQQDWETIEADWNKLNDLIKKQQLHSNDFSKRDVLLQRKEMDETTKSLINSIRRMKNPNASKAINYLLKSQSFAKQTNDLHFKYANNPSRSFSNVKNFIEKWGGRLALAASIIGILSVATALTLPALGLAAPAALATTAAVCTGIVLAVGMPLAMKKLGESIYNAVKYKVAPTKGEVVNAALLGTSFVTAGVCGLIGASALQGVPLATAAGAAKSANNITKVALGLGQEKSKDNFKSYKKHYNETRETLQLKGFQKSESNQQKDMGAKESVMPHSH